MGKIREYEMRSSEMRQKSVDLHKSVKDKKKKKAHIHYAINKGFKTFGAGIILPGWECKHIFYFLASHTQWEGWLEMQQLS